VSRVARIGERRGGQPAVRERTQSFRHVSAGLVPERQGRADRGPPRPALGRRRVRGTSCFVPTDGTYEASSRRAGSPHREAGPRVARGTHHGKGARLHPDRPFNRTVESIDGMKRLAPCSTWWHRMHDREKTRSSAGTRRGPAIEHVGIDVHKVASQVCVLAEGGEPVASGLLG
jgi:hypothetical protein